MKISYVYLIDEVTNSNFIYNYKTLPLERVGKLFTRFLFNS